MHLVCVKYETMFLAPVVADRQITVGTSLGQLAEDVSGFLTPFPLFLPDVDREVYVGIIP